MDWIHIKLSICGIILLAGWVFNYQSKTRILKHLESLDPELAAQAKKAEHFVRWLKSGVYLKLQDEELNRATLWHRAIATITIFTFGAFLFTTNIFGY